MSRSLAILVALLSATALRERSPAIEVAQSADGPTAASGSTDELTVKVLASRCAALSTQLLSRAAAGGTANRADQEETMRLVRLVEGQGETCVAALIDALARAPACTSGAGFIAATVALDDALSPEVVQEAVAARSPCVTMIVTAAGETPHPGPEFVNVIERWDSEQRDPMIRSGGLVVLGSLAHHARENDDASLASGIDALLVRELTRPAFSDTERTQRLEAVGNAGCARCVPIIRAAMNDRSSEIRRSAVGALRFVLGEQAPRAMCYALDADSAVEVRDQAAWALGWGRDGATDRVRCLVRAAARDPSPRVRIAAARSIAGMAHDVPLARDAMLQLTDPEYDDADLRALALSIVDALPPGPVQTDGVAVRQN